MPSHTRPDRILAPPSAHRHHPQQQSTGQDHHHIINPNLPGSLDERFLTLVISFRFTSSLRPCLMIPTMRPPAAGRPPAKMLPAGTSVNAQFTYSRSAPVIWVCAAVTAAATSALFRAVALSAGMVNW